MISLDGFRPWLLALYCLGARPRAWARWLSYHVAVNSQQEFQSQREP